MLSINVVSSVIYRSGVPSDIAFLVLVFANEMMLYFPKQPNRVVLAVVALGLPSFNYTNVEGYLAAIAVALNADFVDLNFTLCHQLVEEMKLLRKGIVNRNGVEIVNERPRKISHEREEDVRDDTALCWKDLADVLAKKFTYPHISKPAEASSFDEFSFSNLCHQDNTMTHFIFGLNSVLTIEAITYAQTDEEIFFYGQTKRTKHDPPGDKTDPHSKISRHNTEWELYMRLLDKLQIVLEQFNEKLNPTPDGIDEGKQRYQHSETKNESGELPPAPPKITSKRLTIRSFIDEKPEKEAKPTPAGSDGGGQRHRKSGESSTKTNTEPEERSSPEEESNHLNRHPSVDEKLQNKPKATPDGRDGESQRHGDSGGDSTETNADPEELPSAEEETSHSNRGPSVHEDLREKTKPTPDGRDGESQRHGDSGGNSTETNADLPPSPPEEQSKRSSDLFSTTTNKEASQVFEFLRFSLKRGSSRRYQTEFHLEPGMKYPRRDYDFEVLDPKGLPFADYAQYTRPPLHDVLTAPFPTTGAHLLATVRARMHYEAFRLGTFVHMDADHPCCLRLANAGFFYTFQGRMVQCYSCGMRWDDWQPEQDFYTEHKRRRPECLHVQGKDTSNVPIHEGQSSFRSGADITGENIDKSSSVREILKASATNLQRGFQQMDALRHKLEHSVNLTLGETPPIVNRCSTAASNNRNKNAVGGHNFSARPGQPNAEELHNSGSIITASVSEKEQSRPSERQDHDSGAPLSVSANLQHGGRFSSKPRTTFPPKEVVKTYSPPTFNSNSRRSSNNNEDDDNDDEATGDNNYNNIINNSNPGGAAKERQSPATKRTFQQHPLPGGTKAQGVAVRVTEQRRQEETSGNDRAQLPLYSSGTSVQVQSPENPKAREQRPWSAHGQVHDAESALLLPDRKSENLDEPRDVQDCRRELVSKVPTTNENQREAIGQRLVRNSDQRQRTASHGRHQNAPLRDLNTDAVNDIDCDDSALFAAPNTLPGSSEMAGARAMKMHPSVSSSESAQHLCNGEAEPHAIGESSTPNSRTVAETSRSENRVETALARHYHAQNSDQLSKSGGAIPKTTNRQQVTSSRTSGSGQREATTPTASEKDATRQKSDVRRSPSSNGKYGAGEDKIINTERREDPDVSTSSSTYLNGEVEAHLRRMNSAGTPNPDSLFVTAQLMNSSANSRPAVVNGVSHSTSAVTSSFPRSRQNRQQDALHQEVRSRENNVQSRERPHPEIQREVLERRNRDLGADLLTSSTQLSASVVITENQTQPQPSRVQRSGVPNGVTTSVNGAGQARDLGLHAEHLLPGHSSGIPNGVTTSVNGAGQARDLGLHAEHLLPGHSSGIPNGVTSATELGQTSDVGRHEGYQLRGQSSGMPNGVITSVSDGSQSPGQISGISNGTTSANEGSHRFNVRQHEEHPTSAQSSGVPIDITPADERSQRFNVPQQDHQRTSTRTSTSTSQAPLFPQAETEASRASIRPGWTQDGSRETSGYQTLPSGHGSSFPQNINQTTSSPQVLVYSVVEPNRPSLSSVSDPPPSQAQASASPASGYDSSKALYPNYRERPKRLESFAQWANQDQDPEELVDAGFFFAGPPDCVRCFHCGLGLKDWDPEDDPFEEHARWRGTCAYLAFFQEEQIRTRRQALSENRPVGNTFHIYGNRGGQGPAATQTNLAVSTQPARATPSGFQGEDWMTSVAAQRAREMGFMEDAIQYAIVQLLYTRAGRRAVTPQNLIQAILYIRERNENALVANNRIGNDDGSSDDDITESFFVSDDDEISNDSDDDGENLSATATAAGDAGDAPGSKDNSSIITNNSRMTKNELKKLEEENKELQERMRCKVCLDSMACVLFVPCRHRVCCVDCAARLRKCPMCRRVIRGSVPITPAT